MRPVKTITPLLAALTLLGCGAERRPAAEPAEHPAAAEAGHEAEAERGPGLPLREIMQALGADMNAAATAVWADDRAGLAAAARRIADHPPVTAEQRSAIQAALGADFPGFVRYDQAVHGAAVELAARADSGVAMSALLQPITRIQQGCVGCHESFRARVAPALADSAGAGRAR